jgi:hypothetical protein
MFVPYLKDEETRVISLNRTDGTAEAKTSRDGKSTWTDYRYSVKYWGDDEQATRMLTPLEDDPDKNGKRWGWTFDAPEDVHKLIQSCSPRQDDSFLIKRGAKGAKPLYTVWVFNTRGQKWEEIEAPGATSFDPNAVAQEPAPQQASDTATDQRPTDERKEAAANEMQESFKPRGMRVVNFIALSTMAGLADPALREVELTDGQVTSYMIAASATYGGRFGDNWKDVNLDLIDREIQSCRKVLSNVGLHPYFTASGDDEPDDTDSESD